MKILDRYIDQLLEKSSPSRPIWNIEKIRQGAKPSWNYMDGCMINAILELYHITQKEEYLDFADRFIDYFVEEDGSIHSYDPKEHNLDNVNAGKTLFDLYDLTGKEKYRLAIATLRSPDARFAQSNIVVIRSQLYAPTLRCRYVATTRLIVENDYVAAPSFRPRRGFAVLAKCFRLA